MHAKIKLNILKLCNLTITQQYQLHHIYFSHDVLPQGATHVPYYIDDPLLALVGDVV